MKRMTPDEKLFRGSSQQNFISSSNLRNHPNLQYEHKINPLLPSTKLKKRKKNLENRTLLKHSIMSLFLETHKQS